MREIEKLFKKISKKERNLLRSIINELPNKENWQHLNIKKLKDSDFYRLRKGKFRLIFHYNSSKEIIIDSIRLRDKDTYKNF